MTEGSGAERQGVGGVFPDFRGGGFRLTNLKAWRLHRDLSQVELARRAGVDQRHLSKIERVEAGCKLPAAQRLAEALGVEVDELRGVVSKENKERPPEVSDGPYRKKERPPEAPKGSRRSLHRAYLKLLLGREVGSAYSALDEEQLEKHCEWLPWEGVLEVVSCREREARTLKGALEDADLPQEVRLFLEERLAKYPDEDIRLLAAARRREKTEKGREELTRTMRELL